MSINNINYLDQFHSNKFSIFTDPKYALMNSFSISEMKEFLNTLDPDKVYVASFEFVSSWLLHEDDSPVVVLSKPILLTKNSNPILITKFIWQKINLAITNYAIVDDVLDLIGQSEGPGVILKFNPINIF